MPDAPSLDNHRRAEFCERLALLQDAEGAAIEAAHKARNEEIVRIDQARHRAIEKANSDAESAMQAANEAETEAIARARLEFFNAVTDLHLESARKTD